MAMLAFFVFVSRYYVTCRNRQFEQSRWMIVVALLLFVVHYMCQMRLGWRQQGNDVGVLFNPNRSLEKVSCHFLMTAIRKTALYMLDL